MKADWWDAPLALQILAVSNLPQFPSFCKSQVMSPPHILVIPLPPSFSHANLVAIRENIFGSSRELNQGFRSGSSTSQPPCYISMLCYKFHRFFHATNTVQDWPWIYSLFHCCTRHFSLPHHVPIFSRIHPLGREGRHVWQIVRQLAGEMLPSCSRI